MSRKEKLLTKARNNPAGLNFQEFESLLNLCEWRLDRQEGSHRIWISLQGTRLPIQPKGNKAKGYQVKQFLKIFDAE